MVAERFRIPCQLDGGRHPHASQADDRRHTCRSGCGGDERGIRAEPADPAVSVRLGAANCMLQRGEPVARSRGSAARANRSATRRGGYSQTNRHASAHGKRPAGHWRRHRGPSGGYGCGPSVACPRLPQLPFPSHQHRTIAHGTGVCFRLGARDRNHFGAAPAWLATRTDPAEALRGSGRGTKDRSSFARKALLVVQATLSVVLVAGATMLARSLNKLEHQDFGYQVQNRVEVSVNRPPATYAQPQLASLYRQLEDQLNRLPGVQGSGLALYNPLTDSWGELIMVAGHPPAKLNEESGASWDRVSANYLQNLGMQILRGRAFTAADNETAAPVAIVNEAFVKRFFKSGEDPLDQHFGLDVPEYAGTFRIVGVVRDAKFAGGGLRRPARPMFYVPLAQTVNYPDELMKKIELVYHFLGGKMLVTDIPPGALEAQLTRMFAELDPNLTINSIRTMQQQIELSFDQERAVASLAGLFGTVALILAAIGLYGVTAYSVAQRTNEIGIRMALGADRPKVLRLILGGAFKRVLIGLILGLPLAVGAGRLLSAQLYGVSSWDPFALSVAAGALAICSFFAAIIPANRAASISPMNALRI